MSVNLIRNARVFLTTNVNESTKKIASSGFTAANTFEIQILDGLSFTQTTGAEQVTVSEAGTAPMRGQRSFNTTLEPVDWSFSTYLRPTWFEMTAEAGDDLSADDKVTCEEDCLWKVFAGDSASFPTGSTGWSKAATGATRAWNEITSNGTTIPYAWWNLNNSDKNQLIPFGLIIVFDDVTFAIHNCAMESVSIDFGIDAIATAAWTGRGTLIEKLTTKVAFGTDTVASGPTTSGTGAFSQGLTGNFRKKYTTSRYIANKLSELSIKSVAASAFGQSSAIIYNIPITGGNVTIANNLTYLTPATVGVVNQPFEYFTGARTVTGNVTAYLRVGQTTPTTINRTAELISDLSTQALLDDENQFEVFLSLGGPVPADTLASTDLVNKVVIDMPRTMLQIPNISTDQVVSTTINFMPQSSASEGSYNLTSANEVSIRYFSGPPL
jgi:hypothetical protein